MIRRGRLVLRIYAIGLLQVAALGAALAIVRAANRRDLPPHADQTRFIVEEITARAPDVIESLKKTWVVASVVVLFKESKSRT